MISLTRPSQDTLMKKLKASVQKPFSYNELGKTQEQKFPSGYEHSIHSHKIGTGQKDFKRAVQLFKEWRQFPQPLAHIFPEDSVILKGVTVIVVSRKFGFWWTHFYRVLYKIDEERCFGFAYGTLQEQLESGEELFMIEWNEDDSVQYSLRSFLKPNHFLTKLFKPFGKQVRAEFRRKTFNKMESLVSDKA